MSQAQVNLLSSDGTTATTKVGDVYSIGGSEYIYCLAGGAITQYAACTLSNAGAAVEATTTTSGAKPTVVVIPQFAVASGEYFWGWNGGLCAISDWLGNPFYVRALTLCVHDVKLYTTGTAGCVDDSATDLIEGLQLLTTVGGSTANTTCIAVANFKTNVQD